MKLGCMCLATSADEKGVCTCGTACPPPAFRTRARNRPARNVTEKSKEVKVIKKYTQARYYEKKLQNAAIAYTHTSLVGSPI